MNRERESPWFPERTKRKLTVEMNRPCDRAVHRSPDRVHGKERAADGEISPRRSISLLLPPWESRPEDNGTRCPRVASHARPWSSSPPATATATATSHLINWQADEIREPGEGAEAVIIILVHDRGHCRWSGVAGPMSRPRDTRDKHHEGGETWATWAIVFSRAQSGGAITRQRQQRMERASGRTTAN